VGFRGHCPFRQYMKSKPAKYGIKLWALCDSSTSFALNMQVYTGKRAGEPPEKNQGERVVRDLIEVIKGSGRNVTMDNFFTSVPLARHLLSKKLSLVGTLRKNKSDIPVEFLPNRDRVVNDTLFGHQENLTLVSYVPKKGKSVILLSSMHTDAQISNREDKKRRSYSITIVQRGVWTHWIKWLKLTPLSESLAGGQWCCFTISWMSLQSTPSLSGVM